MAADDVPAYVGRMTGTAPSPQTRAPGGSARDPRLDFFRGFVLLIIFVAHTRGNWLADWIPARFGFSDAAHVFVFLSGVAAAIAFGGTFRRSGFLIGAARIALRCWQLYVAHILTFFLIAAIAAAGTLHLGRDYVAMMDMRHFFGDPLQALVDLFTLAYVPQYFDILPLYIVVLAMVPVAVLLARVHPLLVPAASLTLYAAAQAFDINFLGDRSQARDWFFNPFGWQLIFFSGFVLGAKWLPAPGRHPLGLAAATAMLVLGVVLAREEIQGALPALAEISARVWAGINKTNLDPLQYLHFLALAYLVVTVLRGREDVLDHPLARPIRRCGQQALSVFVTGLVYSQIAGMLFDVLGSGAVMQLAVNGSALALLVAVAHLVAWMKSQPWKRAGAAPVVVVPVGRPGTAEPSRAVSAGEPRRLAS